MNGLAISKFCRIFLSSRQTPLNRSLCLINYELSWPTQHHFREPFKNASPLLDNFKVHLSRTTWPCWTNSSDNNVVFTSHQALVRLVRKLVKGHSQTTPTISLVIMQFRFEQSAMENLAIWTTYFVLLERKFRWLSHCWLRVELLGREWRRWEQPWRRNTLAG